MTEEFKDRMNKAIENGVLVARKQNEEYLEKVEFNKKYADLYTELVLAAVETFDFNNGFFRYENISEEFLEKFGDPKRMFVTISDETKQEGMIALDYGDENPWRRAGEPEFKKYENFDLEIINNLLAENGIHIREDYVDSEGNGSQNDYITFDARMIIEKMNELLEENPNKHQGK